VLGIGQIFSDGVGELPPPLMPSPETIPGDHMTLESITRVPANPRRMAVQQAMMRFARKSSGRFSILSLWSLAVAAGLAAVSLSYNTALAGRRPAARKGCTSPACSSRSGVPRRNDRWRQPASAARGGCPLLDRRPAKSCKKSAILEQHFKYTRAGPFAGIRSLGACRRTHGAGTISDEHPTVHQRCGRRRGGGRRTACAEKDPLPGADLGLRLRQEFLEVGLPTWLAGGNLPAISRMVPTEFVLLTSRKTRFICARIRVSNGCRRYARPRFILSTI